MGRMDWCLRYTDNESELFFATKPLSRAGLVPATRLELHARLKPLKERQMGARTDGFEDE
jgi:hypothetical protein